MGTIALCSITMITEPVSGAVLVYEPFNYGTAGANRAGSDLLHGQPDGSGGDVAATGLGGTWQDQTTVVASSDMFVAESSLNWGDLLTSGNHVRTDTNGNNDTFSRPITTSISGGSEIWFGFLANKLQNNFSAAEGGIVIGNQTVNSSRVLLDTGSTGLQGFGIAPTTAGNNWTGYAWDGTSQTDVGANLGVAVGGTDIRMLIGHVSFDTGSGGTDEFSFYNYQLLGGQFITGGTLQQIGSTIEVDVTQGSLDTFSLTRQVNTAFDEFRIGETLEDILPLDVAKALPEPGTAAFLLLGVGMLSAMRKRTLEYA